MKAGLLPAWAEGSCDGLSIGFSSLRVQEMSLCLLTPYTIHTLGCAAVGWAVPLTVWLWDTKALPAGPGEPGTGAQLLAHPLLRGGCL